MNNKNINIASRIQHFSKETPQKKAVVFPDGKDKNNEYIYQHLTFKDLDILSNKYALGFKNLGIKKGTKTLVFVKPSLDFSAITFALFKLGAIPIFIDPGMGRKNLFKAIKSIEPEALIAEPIVHFARFLFPQVFSSIKSFVTTGKFTFGKTVSMEYLKNRQEDGAFEIESMDPDETSAILFTSGGTGIPKGVIYTNRIFNKQTDILKEIFSLTSKDIDVPGFPLFSFFTMAMGMTSCIPDMNPSKPKEANPENLAKNINDHKATFVAGSPAIWENLADYCLQNNITLPSVKYLVMFGAPVRNEIHKKFMKILPNGDTYTPYGATEALPVSCINGRFVLEMAKEKGRFGNGTCVGHAAPGIEVKTIPISDKSIDSMDVTEFLPANSVGEIVVKGEVVTRSYWGLPIENTNAKIKDSLDKDDSSFWHRMGDLGYIDEKGLIWFCGRKSHRVEAFRKLKCSVNCESIFNQHDEVKSSALVGIGTYGSQTPAIVIERKDKKIIKGQDRLKFEYELLEMAKKFPHTKDIEKIYLKKEFPVDVRHNIKIDRLKLKKEVELGMLK